jgi:hypothetical protein
VLGVRLLLSLLLDPEDGSDMFLRKLWALSELHGVTIQKTELVTFKIHLYIYTHAYFMTVVYNWYNAELVLRRAQMSLSKRDNNLRAMGPMSVISDSLKLKDNALVFLYV